MKQRTTFYVVATIIFIFGLFLVIPNSVVGPTTDTSQSSAITYQGVEGKNALELLKDNHEVITDSYDFGEFVTGINGQVADEKTFWALYINGELAQVGAGDYQTKPEDTIEWKLETIN